jgi:eukaryotic-like serine/threonine-protein kinase
MTPELWQQVKNILAPALELAPEERPVYLDHACAGNGPLRREVELLLADEQNVSRRFLSDTTLANAATGVLAEAASPWIGRLVGVYRIVEQIGVGGMGEVYRAFRDDDQYRQQVALKVVRAGQDSGFVVARFKHERQILASLDHPNIARLLDGGTTEEGTPYLVMELIEGRPIGEYCDARNLSLSDRLTLFMQVCAAVQYAHQRLIIHRDLKPGNILVTGDGVPKLLDFGIAKILDVEGEQGQPTLTMYRLLTPQYASPEQVKGDPITTASDVYSLGVVLYELLTGQSPYPKNGGAPQAAARAVCEFEPKKPSTAVGPRKTAASDSKLNFDSEIGVHVDTPEKLAKRLRGDLDNIVLMALRKEPQRRYTSVEQFSEDIRRHLAKLPVAARKDTPQYRASKFVTRHKAGVVAAAAIMLIMVAGLVITIREARIAQRRFNDVRSLANSLIFDVHDSIKDLPGSTPARKIIVDRALQYLNVLAQESAGDVGLQRELAIAYERVGTVQGDYLENNLGDATGTLASYQKALEIRKQIGAASSDWNDRLALAQGYRLVAHQQWATGKMRGARDDIDHAIVISEALNQDQPNNPKVLYEVSFDHEVSGTIGYPGDHSASQKIIEDYRRALVADEAALKINPDDIRTLHGYSMDLSEIGGVLEASDPQAALTNYEKFLEINRKLTTLSTELRYQRSVAIGYGSIASVYDDIGDYGRAAENNMKGLAIYQDLNRADPKNALWRQGLAIAYVNTATSWVRVGKIGGALEYSSKGVEIMRTLVASAPQNTRQQRVLAAMLAARGTVLISAQRSEAAIGEFESARSIYESLDGTGATEKPANVAACNVKLGEASAKAGHDQASAEYFHHALAIVEPLLSTDTPDLDALYAAADAYSGLGERSMRRARRPGQTANERKSNWTEARSSFLLSQNTWHRIEHPNHTAPNSFHVGDPTIVAKELKQAEAALSAMH